MVARAAKRLAMTRTRYIATVLARVARYERDAEVSRRVDEVLSLLGEQALDSVRHLTETRMVGGTEW